MWNAEVIAHKLLQYRSAGTRKNLKRKLNDETSCPIILLPFTCNQ